MCLSHEGEVVLARPWERPRPATELLILKPQGFAATLPTPHAHLGPHRNIQLKQHSATCQSHSLPLPSARTRPSSLTSSDDFLRALPAAIITASLQATPKWAARRTFVHYDQPRSLPSTAPCCPKDKPQTS